MKITLAENRGFCPGVRRAVQMAHQALQQYGSVTSLGHLIHNQQVVNDLMAKGLRVVEDVAEVPEGSVLLIRSHGVSPAVIEQAKQRRLTLVDATCGLVRRAQNLVAQLSEQKYHVVVIGDPNHPEVRGLIGYGRDVVVVQNDADVAKLPHHARLGVVSQTTISPAMVAEVVSHIIRYGFEEVKLVNTLCDQSIARQRSATELAKGVNVMFVLGGLHSANTRHLADLCRMAGVKTFHLESFTQFTPDMIDHAQSIGLTAGASTPDALIEEFVTNLQAVSKSR